MARAYDVQAVERKWQQRWADEPPLRGRRRRPAPAQYVLCMYPYPSGPAHQGHVRNYTFGDLLVRHRTMQGFAVLSPFGFDSFGLPGRERRHPHRRAPPDLHRGPHRRAQGQRAAGWGRSTTGGARSAATTPPTSAGTRSSSSDSSRPAWPTGPWPRSTGARAARRCWPTSRCWPTAPASAPATWSIQRELEQWFFRTTAYADELLDSLDDLDWPERVKTMQRNWIGRSEGVEFDLEVVGPRGRDSPCGSSPPAPTRASG